VATTVVAGAELTLDELLSGSTVSVLVAAGAAFVGAASEGVASAGAGAAAGAVGVVEEEDDSVAAFAVDAAGCAAAALEGASIIWAAAVLPSPPSVEDSVAGTASTGGAESLASG